MNSWVEDGSEDGLLGGTCALLADLALSSVEGDDVEAVALVDRGLVRAICTAAAAQAAAIQWFHFNALDLRLAPRNEYDTGDLCLV